MRLTLLEWLLVIALTIGALAFGNHLYQSWLVSLTNDTAHTLRAAGQ